ncbi:MAG: TIGR03960 family B12-binding radical SAM protein [Pirellulales bacterium]|nr:TIGR03960 family B12-binding radical SAM protein [Pirellulales bacterium]
MLNTTLKDRIAKDILPQVQSPGQYIGGEWNAVAKDHRAVRGTLCLAFPDAYSIGMSHNGLQVLYDIMNRRDWACERVFMPLADMEEQLRRHGLPLYGLETYTPLARYDVLGFTLQYDLCATNVLAMLDLGGIPLQAVERTMEHPLVIAGGPCAVNPEPMARFIDLFVIGDGEKALPAVCDAWIELKRAASSLADREALLLEMAPRFPFVYVPRFYDSPRRAPTEGWSGEGPGVRASLGVKPIRQGIPSQIIPAVVDDLDAAPLPTAPIVPHVECVHDRIAIEIMRGCPGKCRFCQSTTIKRPLRFRKVETIVEAALAMYHSTGYNEISLLSLSTSDYPRFDELMRRMQATFRPLGVSVSLPSLRINEQLREVGELLTTERHGGLTLAPEVALDDMRERVGKPITNEDLYAGCRRAFENGFSRVKLYFMCGLPGEREEDLDGIIEMAEHIARLGKEVTGRFAAVVANVSNFVPKPQTPFQWNAMQRREYFYAAHSRLRKIRRLKCVEIKCHDVDTTLLEGVLCRGDRRVGEAIELVFRRGGRFDAWREHFNIERWLQAFAELNIDIEKILHLPSPAPSPLPWDHIAIRQGRGYLEREYEEALKTSE